MSIRFNTKFYLVDQNQQKRLRKNCCRCGGTLSEGFWNLSSTSFCYFSSFD